MSKQQQNIFAIFAIFLFFFIQYSPFSGIGTVPLGSGTDTTHQPSTALRLLGCWWSWVEHQVVRLMQALLPPAPCNLNCDKVFPLLSDQYTIPKSDSNPPKQGEDCYQSTPLPRSHHGWVTFLQYFVLFYSNPLANYQFSPEFLKAKRSFF